MAKLLFYCPKAKPHGFEKVSDAVKSTAGGWDFLMSHGVLPRYNQWMIEAGAPLEDQEPPPLEFYIEIEKAYAELRNGSISFDDAVLKYSEEESIKYRGGDIGYVGRDNRNLKLQLGEVFFNKMFQLDKNEISGVLEGPTEIL